VACAIWIFGCVTSGSCGATSFSMTYISPTGLVLILAFGAVVLAWALIGPQGEKAAFDGIPPKVWRIGRRMSGIGEETVVKDSVLNPDTPPLSNASAATSSIRQSRACQPAGRGWRRGKSLIGSR
jgi:hypothetical protein